MQCFSLTAQCEDDTEWLGALLAEVLPDGTTVALCGTLGAGKTRLVQAIAAACGVPREQVVSPTFVICQTYTARRTLHHFDAYRLRDDDEFLQLGPEEYFDSDGLTLIEWGDRVVDCLPAERIELRIEVTGDTSRRFDFVARGGEYEEALDRLQQRV